MEEVHSKEVFSGHDRIYLVAVARAQRFLILLVLVQLIALVGAIVAASLVPTIGLGLFLALPVIAILAIIQTVRLSTVAGGRVDLSVLGGLCMLVPVVGFLVLLSVNQRATGLLQSAGARVGLLGVSRREMNKLIEGACSGCGYDIRDLPTNVCPECGRPFAPPLAGSPAH